MNAARGPAGSLPHEASRLPRPNLFPQRSMDSGAAPFREALPAGWMSPILRTYGAALGGVAVLAAAGALALSWSPRGASRTPGLIAEARTALALEPVLAAEAALRRSPQDLQARLRLAAACEQAHDPAGAALALYPLRDTAPEVGARFARACLRTGWLDEAAAALAPDSPTAARLELAAARVLHGRREQAMALLEGVERGGEEPGADGWLDGAMTWVQCRRPERGVTWAERGLKAAAAAGETEAVFAARLLLGRCLLAAGRPEEALDALPGGSAGDAAPEYWTGRAELRCADAARRVSGRKRLARLAAAHAAHPGLAPAAAFEAGRAFLSAGDRRRAVELLSQAAAARYQEVLAYELLARGYEAGDRRWEAAWSRARALALRGQFSAAVESLQQAVKREPGKVYLHRDLASALESDGRLPEAVKLLERAQTPFPNDLDLQLHLARVLLKVERTQDTIRTLTLAAELEPRRANEPLGSLGTVFFDSQQFDRALPALEQAVAVEDEDAHSHFYLGRTYSRRIEDPAFADQAVRHLLRASLLNPDYPLPWISTASALQRLGHLPEAAACLRRAIAGEPESDGPYLALGQIMQLQGRTAERALVLQRYAATRDQDTTRAALEKETQQYQKDVEKRFRLGDLLLRRGKPEQALPHLLIAASLRRGWPEARSRLADACALLGYDDLLQEAGRALR